MEGITDKDIQKALKITSVLDEYFKSSTESTVQAKELMDLFIQKGIFTKNHRDGLPIRDFLRHLERNNHLHLLPHATFEQKSVNKNWYFINKT